ncbi:glycoside hydrolase family 1 protein [Nonomuraea sp. NPDC050022]|uniref:glycoside hydrolase family 1 protein n=1 Tax=unclassified Nonomuraea TaxID=2593643 RepID=UPI0033EAAB3C
MSATDAFLWGASTAPHQIEGNNINADWWEIENTPGVPFPDRSGDALDSFHRYGEDMRLLAGAGLNAYRFGFEWARIQPEEDMFSRAMLDHYRRMVDTALELGIQPVVTLQHFTSPRWFAHDGGWENPRAVDRFRGYIEYVSPALDNVDWVCTINEPNMMALFNVLAKLHNPDAKLPEVQNPASPLPDLRIGEIFANAHRAARDVLHEHTDANVGWTIAQQALEPTPGNEDVFDRVHHQWEGFYLSVSREDDFVGVQSYTSQTVGPDGVTPHSPSEDNTITGWAYRPDALGISLRRAWDEAGGVPLLITENGIATADDDRRIAYTTEALRHLKSAVNDGIDVRGYLHWTLLDNYEWGDYGPTFGLIEVDRQTFVRTPKPSLAWLGSMANGGFARL